MNYKDYVTFGLNHHLLYAKVASIPSEHERTLIKLLDDDRLEALDLWITKEQPFRDNEIKALNDSNKIIFYNVGPRKGQAPAHPATLDPEKRKYSLDFYKEQLDMAIEVGAAKVVTNSGPNNPENRTKAIDALVEFYIEICRYVPDEMLIMVEPTDWNVDKCKLIGSSKEAFELSKRIQAAGCKNFSSMVDMGHLPLMHETIEQGIKDSGDQIGHIHMGNCILKDKSHLMFGDKHVAWGIDGSEYDLDDVASLLRIALETGYFNNTSRGSASIEMRPIPGKTPEQSLDVYCDTFCKACWK